MKFAIDLKYGDGSAFLQKLKKEGEDTYTYIHSDQYKPSYDGLAKKARTFQEWFATLKKDDIVVFDSVYGAEKEKGPSLEFKGSGAIGDVVRKRGIKTVGGQKIQEQLELDRLFGIDFMRECGIKVPETKSFKNKPEAIAWIKKNPKRYVYKPFGNISCAKTYVADDAEDLINYLGKAKETAEFILQEFKEGIELSTEVIFADGNPMSSNNTIETKKFGAGYKGSAGTGSATGCMSSIVWAHKDLNNKAVKEGIGKAFAKLKALRYSGALDLNSIVDKQGNLWGIEWTCRFGYSGIYAYLMIVKEKFSEMLKWMASGKANGEIPSDKENYGITVRVSVPPYPLEYDDQNSKFVKPLLKLTAGQDIEVFNDKFTYWFLDVKLDKGKLVTAGTDGCIFELGYKAKDLQKAQDDVNECLKSDIRLSNAQFRTDWAERAMKQIPELAKLGYETI